MGEVKRRLRGIPYENVGYEYLYLYDKKQKPLEVLNRFKQEIA